ncbi:MAG: hypothetical protein R3A10_11620 [Caldilineaceae bacterium]
MAAPRSLHMSPSILAADTANGSGRGRGSGGGAALHPRGRDGQADNFAFSPKNIDDLRRVTTLPLRAS